MPIFFANLINFINLFKFKTKIFFHNQTHDFSFKFKKYNTPVFF